LPASIGILYSCFTRETFYRDFLCAWSLSERGNLTKIHDRLTMPRDIDCQRDINTLLSASPQTSGFWWVSSFDCSRLETAFDRVCSACSDNGWTMQTVSTVNGYDGDALNLWFPWCHITRKRSSSTRDRISTMIKRHRWIAGHKLRTNLWITIQWSILRCHSVIFSLSSFTINVKKLSCKIMKIYTLIPSERIASLWKYVSYVSSV